jgi:hypothetical protein
MHPRAAGAVLVAMPDRGPASATASLARSKKSANNSASPANASAKSKPKPFARCVIQLHGFLEIEQVIE